ncbi:malectin domain-containing carbohydrate-binding protein [Nibricoccus aquaticus]|uniref:malectin domain-containing carbohydrate-binding protein n=1 Tax=Nibricoccus aquaticus TaxID=2576891 RepID=UPI001586CE61|nr:malectin domain-containing carbohydrate-binding protein [Nibricoccus aquaticus]
MNSVFARLVLFFTALTASAFSQAPEPSLAPRTEIALTDNWRTAYDESDPEKFAASTSPNFDDTAWKTVSIPHNWDDYQGFRQVKAGHLYGHAWYRTTATLPASALSADRRHFLFFEGVGAYATVWVNGKLIGKHGGGLTTFTLDVTDALNTDGKPNIIAVRADHTPGIRDLPWVNGGSERAYGFAEGSQPFGIHRPVRLVSTSSVRVEPFGTQIFADRETLSASNATVHVRTELKNHGATPQSIRLVSKLRETSKQVVTEISSDITLAPGETKTAAQTLPTLRNPQLWSPAHPHLYTLTTELLSSSTNSIVLDRVETITGFRTIDWRGADPKSTDGRFFINNEPFLINGTAEYEHLLGQSHAFSDTQIRARVRQIESAGFNAFRDAHHPHNLRYADYWQRDGILWWPQFGTHIWFDNDAFKTAFKEKLRQWVKERRNNPAVVLWGLQNESRLPATFAAECVAFIREMDPTATVERKITTCNGGEGSDWNVPQNWSGTYGGDPETYAEDLRTQRLVGEYGAWRSLDYHAEGPLDLKGAYTEERFTAIMETKVRLLEKARGYASGHFQWPFATHTNPGRNIGELGEQTRDGWRELDQIGPANNKGLLTIWGEPLDAFYMYRSNFAPKQTDPMVVIASHTWPDRWAKPGKKSGIIVYSNCDEVELFNDLGQRSLGKRTRAGHGTHFTWDDVDIQTNTLYAEGRVNGNVVARDLITLHHLPVGPALAKREAAQTSLTKPAPGQKYLYRVNLGGPDYTDEQGNLWLADRDYREGDAYGTASWAQQFPNLPAAFGSQRKIFDPILGARDDALFQTFRYGRHELRFLFNVPDSNAEYRIELFLTEPWYGTGEGDAEGWRIFDVAVNGETKLRDLDIWKESGGRAHALKKVITARPQNGRLEISFPRVSSYQAVLSAIAISSADTSLSTSASLPSGLFTISPSAPSAATASVEALTHLDTGDRFSPDTDDTIVSLPESLRNAAWVRFPAIRSRAFSLTLTADSDAFLVLPDDAKSPDGWLPISSPLVTRNSRYSLHTRRHAAGSHIAVKPDTALYAVIAVPTRPLPPPQSLADLTLPPGWVAAGHVKMGLPVHTDAGLTFTQIAPNLTDADWLQTPSKLTPGSARPRFTVTDHVEVYVALPATEPTPANWIASPELALLTSASSTQPLALHRRRFAPGQTVDLAGHSPVSVLIRPVRAAFTYQPVATSSDGKTTHTYTIEVGVGSRYGLNFRYATASSEPIEVEQQIITNEGRVLRTDTLKFPPLKPGETSSILRTRTGSSINAGTYQIRLTPLNTTAALTLETLEVE